MAHRPSIHSYVRRLVLKEAYRDKELAETICRSNLLKTIPTLEEKFSYVPMAAINVNPGDVLVDSRGQGCYQQ